MTNKKTKTDDTVQVDADVAAGYDIREVGKVQSVRGFIIIAVGLTFLH